MQGNRELDRTEVGAEVAAGLSDRRDQEIADLFGEPWQLRSSDPFDVIRAVDGLEQTHATRTSPSRHQSGAAPPSTRSRSWESNAQARHDRSRCGSRMWHRDHDREAAPVRSERKTNCMMPPWR